MDKNGECLDAGNYARAPAFGTFGDNRAAGLRPEHHSKVVPTAIGTLRPEPRATSELREHLAKVTTASHSRRTINLSNVTQCSAAEKPPRGLGASVVQLREHHRFDLLN